MSQSWLYDSEYLLSPEIATTQLGIVGPKYKQRRYRYGGRALPHIACMRPCSWLDVVCLVPRKVHRQRVIDRSDPPRPGSIRDMITLLDTLSLLVYRPTSKFIRKASGPGLFAGGLKRSSSNIVTTVVVASFTLPSCSTIRRVWLLANANDTILHHACIVMADSKASGSVRSGRACKLAAVRGLGLGSDRKSREVSASTTAYPRFGSAVVVSKIFTVRFRFSRSTRLIQVGWAHDASVVRSSLKGVGEEFFGVAE